MLIGSLVVYLLPNRTATWLSLLFLLAIHLLLNHAAVRAVKMRSINRQRANVLFSNLVETGKVMNPQDVSEMESIFERRGGSVFRWLSGAVLGHCDFGVSLQSLLKCLPQSSRNKRSSSTRLGTMDVSTVVSLFQNQQYILWCQPYAPHWYESMEPKTRVVVVLKQGITPESQLRAWYHALLLARRLSRQQRGGKVDMGEKKKLLKVKKEETLLHVVASLDHANKTFDGYARRLREAGWELGIPVLETRLGSRISCENRKAYAHF
jgi:hypothetical protein